MPVSLDPMLGGSAGSPNPHQAGDGAGSSPQPRHLSKHKCSPPVSQAPDTKGVKVKCSAGPRTDIHKLAVATVSVETRQRFPASGKGWSGTEFSPVSWEQRHWWGWERGDAVGGSGGEASPHRGRAGVNPGRPAPSSPAAACGALGSLSRVWLYF